MMAGHSEALPKHKSTRRSSPYLKTRHFPPLVDDFSSQSRQSTRSSSTESSPFSRNSRSSRTQSALSSLSSSSASSRRADSRASSGYSSLSSRGSLMSGKSNRSNQNLDIILEEKGDHKTNTNPRDRPRLLSGPLGESRGDPHSPPPSRVLTGAHYLKWYIPPQIAGSRALNRSAKSADAKCKVNELSPLHNQEKQVWLKKLIDPKETSLPLPPPHKPRLPDHSKTAAKRADNIQQTFSKYQMDTNPKYFANSYSKHRQVYHQIPPTSFSQIKRETPPLKSLLLEHDKQAYSSHGTGNQLDPLSSSFFTNSHLPVQSWFIVNPEWRKEPGKR